MGRTPEEGPGCRPCLHHGGYPEVNEVLSPPPSVLADGNSGDPVNRLDVLGGEIGPLFAPRASPLFERDAVYPEAVPLRG